MTMPPNEEAQTYSMRDLETGRQHSNIAADDLNNEDTNSCLSDRPRDLATAQESSALKRKWRKVTTWVKGPQPPIPYIIVPFGGTLQVVPLKVLYRWLPRRRYRLLLLLAFYFLWLACFIYVIRSGTASSDNGKDSTQSLPCIGRLWPNAPTCGLDGDLCRPFDNSAFSFRCPSYCGKTLLLNPYTVGTTTINYQSLVVGGPTPEGAQFANIYRGDSFICGAAVHAGIISNSNGGCGTASIIGTQRNFPGSRRNGISSLGFNSSFPLSFTLSRSDQGNAKLSQCSDPQWRALAVSVIFTAILSLFTTSTALFFCTTFTATFFQIALVSDPPYFSTFNGVVSTSLARFLPAAFVGLVVYIYCVRYTLRRLTAQLEKTILWLGACWVGALSNYTLEKIPLQRLTPHDIRQQPGGIVALVFIVLVIVTVSIIQAWAFRIEGRLPRYLGIYAILGSFILLLLAIPNLNFRLHHYILALLLFPLTKLQTRPSLLYQGLLVGLFINGVARWGFDSILQTSESLQGDSQRGSLLPTIAPPVINGNNISFSLELAEGYEGISALVNDVERLRKFDQRNTTFSWTKKDGDSVEYFRFGFVTYDSVAGVVTQDYTRAGVWTEDGNWIHMPPGPS